MHYLRSFYFQPLYSEGLFFLPLQTDYGQVSVVLSWSTVDLLFSWSNIRRLGFLKWHCFCCRRLRLPNALCSAETCVSSPFLLYYSNDLPSATCKSVSSWLLRYHLVSLSLSYRSCFKTVSWEVSSFSGLNPMTMWVFVLIFLYSHVLCNHMSYKGNNVM